MFKCDHDDDDFHWMKVHFDAEAARKRRKGENALLTSLRWTTEEIAAYDARIQGIHDRLAQHVAPCYCWTHR